MDEDSTHATLESSLVTACRRHQTGIQTEPSVHSLQSKCDVRSCTAISSGHSCRQPCFNFTEHLTSHTGGGVGADRHLCGELSAVCDAHAICV